MAGSEYLVHGGIMANYRCTAACRHCLYACSPTRTGDYITGEQAREVCALLREGRCGSVHIGGGEPFLDFEGLLELIREIRRAGIGLEYIETNGYWVHPGRQGEALERLDRLMEAGADALCISVDPFHAEYVAPEKPVLLARLCQEAGMGFFLWKQQYLPVLAGMDMGKKHSRQEMEQAIGPAYIRDTAGGYGLHYGGRAVNIEEEYGRARPAGELADSRPCRGILSTNHFHVDLYGRFIPPGCTGLAIPLEEVVRGIPPGRYPVWEALVDGGAGALLELARSRGFRPDPAGYASRCALCFRIRHWLAENSPSPELDPEHYRESLAYY